MHNKAVGLWRRSAAGSVPARLLQRLACRIANGLRLPWSHRLGSHVDCCMRALATQTRLLLIRRILQHGQRAGAPGPRQAAPKCRRTPPPTLSCTVQHSLVLAASRGVPTYHPAQLGLQQTRPPVQVMAAAAVAQPGLPTAAVAQLPYCMLGTIVAPPLAAASLATGAAANALVWWLDGYSQVRCACQ